MEKSDSEKALSNCSLETLVSGTQAFPEGAECRVQSCTDVVMMLCQLHPGPPLLMEKIVTSLEGSVPLPLLACMKVSEVKPRCSRLL